MTLDKNKAEKLSQEIEHQDLVVKGMINDLNVRFSYISLGASWQDMHQMYAYPEAVKQELGKILGGTTLLKSLLKEDYTIYMQMQDAFHGIDFLTAQARPAETQDKENVQDAAAINDNGYFIRAMARWSDAENADAEIENNQTDTQDITNGRLIVTVSSPNTQKYQGIVAVERNQDIAFNLANYFTQSEQLKTWLKIYVDNFCVKGIMVQALPSKQPFDYAAVDKYINESNLQQWQTQLLVNTPEQMIKDTFYSEDITMYPAETVSFVCTCSMEKIHQVVQSMGKVEVMDIIEEQGKIEMNCDFCQEQYLVSEADAQTLFLET